MTSPQLDTHAMPGDDWQGLRRPDTLGIALLDVKSPRCLAVDPKLCAALGHELGALDGVLVTDLEPDHPLAHSLSAWRRHVRNIRKADRVHWLGWLAPRSGTSIRARLRLQVQTLERHEYLVAEVVEWVSADSEPDDPCWTSLDNIPIGACRIAPDGSILASNSLARSFLELEFDLRRKAYNERLPKRPLSIDGAPMPERDLPWFRALQQGRPQPSMTLGLSRTDGLRWMLVSVTPDFRPESTQPSSVLLTLADVTSGKLASDALRDADHNLRRTISSVSSLQDQLARSEHMASLGLMAAGVAHEINNPLSYILSNLSFAAERAIDQESRLALREALEGAGRVRDIVRDLKTLSRMDSEDELKPLDVRNAVDAALKLAFDEVRHRAKIQRHFSEVPHVLGDETRLVQVMLNLVTNAAQSIAPGAPDGNQISVEVKLADSGEEVEIVVSDTGVGISRTHLPKVFEPFFTTKPAGEGTGLGLSICHRLVHGMGGHIHVSSEEGKGSRFSVFLCAAAPLSEVDHSLSSDAVSSSRRLRLLIVDDEAMVARAAQRIFEAHFQVEIALDGKSALEKLEHAEYDVVLCDVMMPGLTGLDVYRQVRLQNEGLAARFVFATGGLFNQELSDSVKRLSNMIVEKPYDPKALRQTIEAAALLRPSGITVPPSGIAVPLSGISGISEVRRRGPGDISEQ